MSKKHFHHNPNNKGLPGTGHSMKFCPVLIASTVDDSFDSSTTRELPVYFCSFLFEKVLHVFTHRIIFKKSVIEAFDPMGELPALCPSFAVRGNESLINKEAHSSPPSFGRVMRVARIAHTMPQGIA